MTTGRFQGKTVLVTGAGRGFGAVLANAFAREGADVIVHYHSSSAGAEETVAAVKALGRRATMVRGDISSLDDVRRITAQSFEFGPLDILVNNVGDMALEQKSWRELDEKAVDHM